MMMVSDLRPLFEPPHDKTNKMTVHPAKTQISLGTRPVWSDGWMDELGILRPFNSISVISRRWKGEHERLCAMKRRSGSGRISPPVGFQPATPWSEVGSANRSATRTLLVWSESLLSAWRKLGSLATHWVHSKDAVQTRRMPRLIWVFAGCTVILLGFVMRRLISFISQGSSWLRDLGKSGFYL